LFLISTGIIPRSPAVGQFINDISKGESMHTPCYVFSSQILIENYNIIKNRLSECKIYFALKSNSIPFVIDTLNKAGCSFECASIGEFDRLISQGVSVDNIINGQVIKKTSEIEYLYQCGCRYFVFDSYHEMGKIKNIAPKAKKILRIRINDIIPTSIGYGMIENEIQSELMDKAFCEIDGISFHISNHDNKENMLKVFKRAEKYLSLISKFSQPILTIGGGWSLEDLPIYDTLADELMRIKSTYSCEIYAEPGKCIINSAGRFYTKVIAIKKRENTLDVYVDGSSANGILRHPNKINVMGSNEILSRKVIYRFFDMTCMNTNLFVKRLNINIKEGDIIEFEDYGAYTIVFQNEFHVWSKANVIGSENKFHN
jgi:Diaminopimelate decarboxylase